MSVPHLDLVSVVFYAIVFNHFTALCSVYLHRTCPSLGGGGGGGRERGGGGGGAAMRSVRRPYVQHKPNSVIVLRRPMIILAFT